MGRTHNSVLDQETADAVRERLRAGESVRAVADSLNVRYLVVWRIATGVTWRSGDTERLVAERAPRRWTPGIRDQFFFQKLQTSCSNKEIALLAGCSEATASQMMRDAEVVWSKRIMVMCMRSGSDDLAMTTYGFTKEQIQALYLILHDKNRVIPSRLREELKTIERT